jgi:hypothetical protein
VRRGALLAFLVLASVDAAFAQPQFDEAPSREIRLPPAAAPSDIVAAELGFARRAREEGQWTAFRATATPDAVMFVPQPVNAQAWLKKRADPPAPVRWRPHAVYMPCDGSYGVATGDWQRPDGSTGYFTTLWQRQKDGDYRWVLDSGDDLATPRAAPEAIGATIATCAPRRAGPMAPFPPRGRKPRRDTRPLIAIPVPPPASFEGRSDDGTMRWRWAVEADLSRRFTVWLRQAGGEAVVIDDKVGAPPA